MRRPHRRQAQPNAGAFFGSPVMIPVPMHTLPDDYRDQPAEPTGSDREPEPEPADLVHRLVDRHWLLGSVVTLAVVVAIALWINAQPLVPQRISQATASVMAYQAFLAGQPSGAAIGKVTVDAIDPIAVGPTRAWQVTISGDVTTAGGTAATHRSTTTVIVDDDGETQVLPPE